MSENRGIQSAQGAVWRPRPILSGWTHDQAAAAAYLPEATRLAIPAANGVGKTFLAADLAVSFIQDMTHAEVIITAPTNRQVAELLWPHITNRLLEVGLSDLTWHIPVKPTWAGGDGDHLIGFATNSAQRMQGFHAEHLLIIIDETSGMREEITQALEGIAVAPKNYIVAIGNPNTPDGPFFQMTRTPSWKTHTISALTHPNIIERREVIPGATSWDALLNRLKDWCKKTEHPTPDSFALTMPGDEAETNFEPNDAFRIRYLGRFPHSAEWALYNQTDIAAAQDSTQNAATPTTAALDVAREGGDRTIYAIRTGDTVTRMATIPADDLMTQAQEIAARLIEDNPRSITIDAAGLGIGVIDRLRQITEIPVIAFLGAAEPTSPAAQKKYLNRRAMAYGNLAIALKARRISIPKDQELADELSAIKYNHTADGRMQIEDKTRCKTKLGRSPDAADTISLLWDRGTDFAWPTTARPTPAEPEPW